MKAHVHYEAAFEQFLQARQIPYVAVDEGKKAAFRDARLKSFDFIVYSQQTCNWLADVKGRRWAPRRPVRRAAWQNWITRADIEGLEQWQEVFGSGFRAMLVFAYWLDGEGEPPREVVYSFRGERYVFAGIPLDEYKLHVRLRSPKWDTVNVPAAEFARHVRPIADWL